MAVGRAVSDFEVMRSVPLKCSARKAVERPACLRLRSPQSLKDALAQYESKIAANEKWLAQQRRVLNTVPLRAIDE